MFSIFEKRPIVFERKNVKSNVKLDKFVDHKTVDFTSAYTHTSY